MVNDWRDKTDDELVEEAQAGLRGQGAAVEMVRRLIGALVQTQNSTTDLTERIRKLNLWLLWFPVAIFALTVVQVVFTLPGLIR